MPEAKLHNLVDASGMPPPTDNRTKSQRPQRPEMAEQDRVHAALQAGNVGIWHWDLKSGEIQWDEELTRVLDTPPPRTSAAARNLLRHVISQDRLRLANALRSAHFELKPIAVEIRIRRATGETRWIAVRGAPTKVSAAGASALSGVAYDITDQKLSLSRTDALLREVSHRSKNLLALILAMARLTARDAVDVKSHLKDFTLRVAGLSASQDLIVASDWQSVDLATLASAEIGAVARTDADRIAISGPPVSLTPEAAQTFGMVVTELALNAVEHGALSAATGEVRLSWSCPERDTIVITWRESGGPPFVDEGPKGYGRSVVERFSAQGLKLAVGVKAERDGVTWTLSGPISNIGTRVERKN